MASIHGTTSVGSRIKKISKDTPTLNQMTRGVGSRSSSTIAKKERSLASHPDGRLPMR